MKKLVEKNINIEAINPGMIASSDIYKTDSKILLYRAGTILSDKKIDQLKNIGVMSIKVKLYEDMIPKKTNEEIVISKLKLEFNEVVEYANYIVSAVLESKSVKYLMKTIDSSTFTHSQKVAFFSTMIGMHLENFSQEKLEELALASVLHDIGKSLIDFSILNKPGRLTDEEYKMIKEHSYKGYDILTQTGLFDSNICETVLSHHENEDGSGYPYNLKGDQIPLNARIIHVCDVYSALTTKRCYKDSWTSDIAIEIMEKEIQKYEPNLLNILKTSLPIYRKDDLVFLSSNKLGTVINQTCEGTIVKVFGTKELVTIPENNNSEDIYIKKKIKVS